MYYSKVLIKFLPLLPWMYTRSVWSVEPRYIVCYFLSTLDIFFFSSSRCLSRSCGLFVFVALPQSIRSWGWSLNSQQSTLLTTNKLPQQENLSNRYRINSSNLCEKTREIWIEKLKKNLMKNDLKIENWSSLNFVEKQSKKLEIFGFWN